jgi:hypothetical protein
MVLALLGAACAPGADEVASLGEAAGRPPASAAASQGERAELMAACLSAAGLPAETLEYPGDSTQAWVVVDTAEAYDSRLPDGTNLLTPYNVDYAPLEAEWDQVGALTSQYSSELDGAGQFQPYLVVGATDHTAAFAECLDQTGYTNPAEPPADPSDELKEKQDAAVVSAAWAQCARDNGFPNTKDPQAPVADNYQSNPTAALPVTITESELRLLLEACPPLDAEAHAAWDEAVRQEGGLDPGNEEQWARLQDAAPYPYDPVVGFDAPFFRGDGAEFDAAADPELAERLTNLQNVVYQVMDDWRNRDEPLLRDLN